MLMSQTHQQGSFMIEALIGIVIFLMGVLAMIALQASSIAIQTDAQYRNEASNLVDQILGPDQPRRARRRTAPWLPVPWRASPINPTGGTTTCRLLIPTDGQCQYRLLQLHRPGLGQSRWSPNWVAAVSTDAGDAHSRFDRQSRQQIVVNAGASNQVIITVCWQGPKDARPRFHRVIGYVN
jgi:hypothetical protein